MEQQKTLGNCIYCGKSGFPECCGDICWQAYSCLWCFYWFDGQHYKPSSVFRGIEGRRCCEYGMFDPGTNEGFFCCPCIMSITVCNMIDYCCCIPLDSFCNQYCFSEGSIIEPPPTTIQISGDREQVLTPEETLPAYPQPPEYSSKKSEV